MNESVISRLCAAHLGGEPQSIRRCAVGQGNYVYTVEYGGEKYIFRLSGEENAYVDTIRWLESLARMDIPVPRIMASGRAEDWEYLVLSYIEGEDLGVVYHRLTASDKRTIAAQAVRIQKLAAQLKIDRIDDSWTWSAEIEAMLDRAHTRIAANGYFDTEKVDRLRAEAAKLGDYFASIRPVPYLDDITTKNLLVCDGQVSGVIDVDWIGVGDVLTFAALTDMALRNMECDTDYVRFLLEELQPDAAGREAFLFYTLMYCVDFMGERGTQFLDRHIEVSSEIIERLNRIYDELWHEWTQINQ